MRFFFFLILLSCIFVEYSLTINDNDYIRCTSQCSPFYVSFSEPLAFPPECQDNNNSTNIYDYALVCGIEYRIDYQSQQISIDFHVNNSTDSLNNQKPAESLVQTILFDFNQQSNGNKTVSRNYACNINDDCARNFYKNTIEYLINAGQAEFDKIKSKLYNPSALIGPNAKRRCTDSTKTGNRTSVRCQYGLCFARYGHNQVQGEEHLKTQKCENDTRSYLSSSTENHIPKSDNERALLELRCNKNVCNRDEIINKLENIALQFTNWNSKIQEDNTINEKTGNSSIKQTIASYFLVLFLILIQLFL